ncbi:BNR-4 repeat-containing protein [Streptosporangiaceae bacterium NEAU-GS5]|nr:BNR-4 repeat-containing protein [Streptosporangiaceae bacterium NEAU-GS5]
MNGILFEDVSWCWWTRPRAVRIGNQVFFGALDSTGRIYAATWDLETRRADRTILAAYEADDHNNPAIVAVPGRPLVAFYSRHDCGDTLQFRVSRKATDIGRWHPPQDLKFGGETSYAQVHPRGAELHLFTRVDEIGWGYRRSGDWAATWDEPVPFLVFDTDQQVYLATTMLADGRTVRMAVSGHPKEYLPGALHDVWVCQADLETGEVSLPGDGAVIGNLRDRRTLPISQDQLEVAYRTPPGRTVNLFDVSDGPDFEVSFVSKVKGDDATVDARYHVGTATDGGWRTEDVAPAGSTFGYIPAGFYAGGTAFPHRSPGGRVYLTREEGGVWHFERRERTASGLWEAHPLLPPGPVRIARPWAVTDPAGGLDVVALAVERYDEEYFGTLSHLVAGGGYPGAAG